MLIEIECPNCRNRVVPRHRFSMAVFIALLALGIVPFILGSIGYYMLQVAITYLLKAVPHGRLAWLRPWLARLSQ